MNLREHPDDLFPPLRLFQQLSFQTLSHPSYPKAREQLNTNFQDDCLKPGATVLSFKAINFLYVNLIELHPTLVSTLIHIKFPTFFCSFHKYFLTTYYMLHTFLCFIELTNPTVSFISKVF